MEKLSAGQVRQEHADRDRQKQKRLKLLFDRQINEHTNDHVHSERFDKKPLVSVKQLKETRAFPKS
jgi:hypothetical protein